ncbi:MAG: endonuclease/exonuclease/phosphatase family protein [Bacteroidales bacterium]|nr:endonuclease/exonuclease/phosphatase family protein [Bacteroidales bacterium]
MRKSFLLFLLLLGKACLFAQDTVVFTVMTFNMRYADAVESKPEYQWEARRDAVAEMLNEEHPDILCTQEGLIRQIRFLEENLTDYQRIGVGREDGKEQGEHSAIFIDTNRYALLDTGNFWLSQTPETPSLGWDAHCIRVATWVRLSDKRAQKEIFVINTHLDHAGEKARENSVHLLVERIRAMVPEGTPFILTGDMNANPEEPLFQTFGEAGFSLAKDCVPDADDGNTYNAFSDDYPRSVIDHQYFKLLKVNAYRRVTKDYGIPYLSDHFAVSCLYEWVK